MNLMETLQDKIEQIQLKLSDDESRNKILIISFGILIFLLILLILILCFSSKDDGQAIQKKDYEITEYFYSPSSPEISDDYMYSRTPKNKWSEDEAAEYITLPTEEMLENLKKSNDKMIKDILEASP